MISQYLKKILILVVGLPTFNVKHQVPNDIIESELFIPKENLKTQKHINSIQHWTDNQKIILNEEKTTLMIFNFTRKHQFSTRLTLKERNIEMVSEMELLGVIVTNDLKWNNNAKHICKKKH